MNHNNLNNPTSLETLIFSGKEYMRAAAISGCKGCAGINNDLLCQKFPDCIGSGSEVEQIIYRIKSLD